MTTAIEQPGVRAMRGRWASRVTLGVALTLVAALTLSAALPVQQVQAQAAADEKRDAEARGLFDAGKAAFEAGRFDAALSRWQEAYELSGRPALQYNIGLAFDRLRRDQQALAAFRAYLAWDAEGERAEEVRGRIEGIERAMAEREAAQREAEQPEPVASPQEAAATVADPVVEASEPSAPVDAPVTEPSLTQQWWFWPSVGAVATGVLVGIVAAASGGEDRTEREPALELDGEVGMNYTALRRGLDLKVRR